MYEIAVAEGKLMEIEFTEFELESSCMGQCKYDYVMVVDAEDDDGDGVGDDEDDILLPKTCSNKIPAPFTSKSNKVQVHFKTDETVQKKGWRLVYTEL
jgi:hypothetical protein